MKKSVKKSMTRLMMKVAIRKKNQMKKSVKKLMTRLMMKAAQMKLLIVTVKKQIVRKKIMIRMTNQMKSKVAKTMKTSLTMRMPQHKNGRMTARKKVRMNVLTVIAKIQNV